MMFFLQPNRNPVVCLNKDIVIFRWFSMYLDLAMHFLGLWRYIFLPGMCREDSGCVIVRLLGCPWHHSWWGTWGSPLKKTCFQKGLTGHMWLWYVYTYIMYVYIVSTIIHLFIYYILYYIYVYLYTFCILNSGLFNRECERYFLDILWRCDAAWNW